MGYVISNSFSLEKALSLKPDVLVIPKVQYEALAEQLPRFAAAGIPVVVVDFNDQTIENHSKSIRLFGQLAGTEARAEKIAQEYADGIADIQQRVKAANQPKPKIYIEFGNRPLSKPGEGIRFGGVLKCMLINGGQTESNGDTVYLRCGSSKYHLLSPLPWAEYKAKRQIRQ